MLVRAEQDLDALIKQQTAEETARLRGRLEAYADAIRFPVALIHHLSYLEEQHEHAEPRDQRWTLGNWGNSLFQRR